jgi:hypothetical protein
MLANHRIKKAAALALAVTAIAPAAATAKPVGPDPSGATFTMPQSPVVRITTPASGFDWGDAGIGAAGGVALAILGVGTALAVSDRHPRRANRPAAPTR